MIVKKLYAVIQYLESIDNEYIEFSLLKKYIVTATGLEPLQVSKLAESNLRITSGFVAVEDAVIFVDCIYLLDLYIFGKNKIGRECARVFAAKNAQFLLRIPESEIPDNSVVVYREMHSQHGWFPAKNKYNLPVYCTLFKFPNMRQKIKYLKMCSGIEV